MDVRKVQKVSTGTYVVSLPKGWAVRHGVRQGTLLSLRENQSGSLIVDVHAQRRKETMPRIADPDTLEQSIVAAYILGAEEIIVAELTPQMRARALATIQTLPGMEVAHETPTTLTIRSLLDESTVRFFAMLDRMCVLLEYGVQLAFKGDSADARQNEREIDRSYHLCQRILARAAHDAIFLEQVGIPSSRVIPSLQLLVKRLEHAGDAVKELPRSAPPKARACATESVRRICAMVRLLSAGKLSRLPVFDFDTVRKGHAVPQALFLARTAEDVHEEIVLLRMAMAMDP